MESPTYKTPVVSNEKAKILKTKKNLERKKAVSTVTSPAVSKME